MKRSRLVVPPGIVAALLAFAAYSASAQSAVSDPFNGSWRLNAAKSAASWQSQPPPKRPAPEPQSQGLITMKIANGMMDYRVEHGSGNGQPKQASYTAAYNDAKWREVQGSPDGAFSAVTLVKIDDRLHYWVTRDRDGQFAGLTQRKMADDGRSFTSTGIGTDGYVQYVRVFEKQ